MYPEILKIGDFVISSYGLMMVVAFLMGNYLLRRDIVALGYEPEIADDITFQAAIGGILGAKLYYLIENIPGGRAADNLSGLLDIMEGILTFDGGRIAGGIQNFGAGMVFLGGLLGGMIAVTVYARKKNIKFLDVADWTAPYVVLGHGIGRIGCFLVGDDYGRPTDLPWAIKFHRGLPISNAGNMRQIGVDVDPTLPYDHVLACHPTQIYEMAAYFCIFAYLRLIVKKNQQYKGQIIFEYLFLAGFTRFVVEFIRLNPTYIFGLSGAQLLSIIMMVIGTVAMWKLRQTKNVSH